MRRLFAMIAVMVASISGWGADWLTDGGNPQRTAWQKDEKIEAKTPSGHILALDSDRETNTGPGPMELLLVALGSCTATDIVIILAKKRQKLESLEVSVSGERADSPPRVLT